MVGAGTSPPPSAGAAHATLELTKNMISPPKSSTPTYIEGGNQILKLNLPMGLEDQELPSNTDSDVTSADSSVTKDDDSTYLKLRETSPVIENTTLDILKIIEETRNILKVFCERLDELNTLRVIFTQFKKIEPIDLIEEE